MSASAPRRSDLPPPVLRALQRAGFTSAMELLLHFPRRHEDWDTTAIADLTPGSTATVAGTITDSKSIPARRARHLLVQLQDAAGSTINLRFFRSTPGLRHFMEIGRALQAHGKVSHTPRSGWEMAHPKFTTTPGTTSRTIYPATRGLASPQIRRHITAVLESADLSPTLPARVEKFAGSDWTLKQSLAAAHAPAEDGTSPLPPEHIAWQRLRFEELVAHQIVLRRRYYSRRANAPAIAPPAGWLPAFSAALPFALTGAQQRAIADIAADMARPYPMRRLLQGDVGSGKTAVAAAACYAAIRSDATAAFMAPTEILAEQHYQTLSALFEKLHIHCELFTGALTPRRRREAENRLRFGIASLAVGTHALFQEGTQLPRLALAVIDEQHRFGVEQRQLLVTKGSGTHQLMMSATPIPRTLALATYADMDVSVLDEKPAGRQPVRTIVRADTATDEVMQRVAEHIGGGGRAYWVCPLVEESGKTPPADMRDVHTLAEQWRARHPGIGIGIIHGRMKAAEKSSAMEKFRRGEHQLLAATTVIEVGVDVAQADVMIIERADRMGLSQLHQLRGRVGRGERGGTCILMYRPPLTPEAQQRLTVMRDTEDGFQIANCDLAMRGPGEWLGSRQSGLPSLRVARLGQDHDLADSARAAAEWLLKNDKRACIRHVRRWLGRLR